MSKEITRIQMAPVIDAISDDGEFIGSRLPYPFFVDEGGFIQNQDLWQGEVYKVIGFQDRVTEQTIDLWWYNVTDPSDIVGKYLVTTSKAGTWSTWPTAVVEAEKLQEFV